MTGTIYITVWDSTSLFQRLSTRCVYNLISNFHGHIIVLYFKSNIFTVYLLDCKHQWLMHLPICGAFVINFFVPEAFGLFLLNCSARFNIQPSVILPLTISSVKPRLWFVSLISCTYLIPFRLLIINCSHSRFLLVYTVFSYFINLWYYY